MKTVSLTIACNSDDAKRVEEALVMLRDQEGGVPTLDWNTEEWETVHDPEFEDD